MTPYKAMYVSLSKMKGEKTQKQNWDMVFQGLEIFFPNDCLIVYESNTANP